MVGNMEQGKDQGTPSRFWAKVIRNSTLPNWYNIAKVLNLKKCNMTEEVTQLQGE